MGRNSGDYVLYPKNIGDALYAATNPSGTNPFVTQSVLDSAVGLNNELSEILANGNTTGGTSIILSVGDEITSPAAANGFGFDGEDAAYVYSPTFKIGAGDVVFPWVDDYFHGTSTGVTLTSAGTVDLASGTIFTAAGGTELNLSAGTDLIITGTDNVTITATNNDLTLVGGNAITATSDSTFTLTSTAGDMDITGANILLTAATGDITVSVADAFSMTSVSTTINTRETIWTTQAAAAIALVDAFKLYSSDIAAGNAAPHFETENGDIVKLFRGATIADAAGGATIDAEARTAINALLARMRVTGGNGLIAD